MGKIADEKNVEREALAALKKYAQRPHGRDCNTCKSPYVEKVDLLLRMATESGTPTSLQTLYLALMDLCPDYPLTKGGLSLHLQNHRHDQTEKAFG